MRVITLVVVHCSAVRPDQLSSAAQIDTWHRQRGFHLGIGYHYVVRRNGEIEPGRPEWLTGAHCQNHQRSLDRRLLRGRARHPGSTRRHAHRGAEGIPAAFTRRSAPALPPRPDRRPSRPESAEVLPLLRYCERICRPTARIKSSAEILKRESRRIIQIKSDRQERSGGEVWNQRPAAAIHS